jgi:hypothetical protein
VDAARDSLAEAGCSVLGVCQAKPEVLSRYLARHSWTVPVVGDPDRAAYRAFGLERTGWLTFLRPRVLWGYFRGMLRGYGLKSPYAGEDVLQLGGDFILERAGTVVFAHPSADPTDRPTVSQLLGAIGRNAPDDDAPSGEPSL